MKKFLAVCIIGLSLGAASVFADHPSGWGVGILGRFGWGYGGGVGGAALSLKAPMLPVYWGLSFGAGGSYFSFGITGDYYLLEGILVPVSGTDGFGYFIGVGGYVGFSTWDEGRYWYEDKDYDNSWTYLGVGVRVPLGLNIVIPISSIKLEIFLDVAPNLGLGFHFYPDNPYSKYLNRSFLGLDWGIPGEIGIRIWF